MRPFHGPFHGPFHALLNYGALWSLYDNLCLRTHLWPLSCTGRSELAESGFKPLSSVQFSGSVVSNSLRPHGLQPTRLLRPWDFPGKNTGVGCHCLLRLSAILHHKRLDDFSRSQTRHSWALSPLDCSGGPKCYNKAIKGNESHLHWTERSKTVYMQT